MQIPPNFVAYGRTAVFTEDTLPQSLREAHSTKAGVWALIHVESGQVRYVIHAEPDEVAMLDAGTTGVIQPEVVHHVEPIGALRMYVEFYRKP